LACKALKEPRERKGLKVLKVRTVFREARALKVRV
jgi:hypothetical protein